jgi:hypothetical protein
MILATLVLASLIAWRLAPRAWRQARLLYWQNKCMNYTAPADRVVFSSTQRLSPPDDPWTRFYSLLSPPGSQSAGTIFVGALTSPNGNRRLVAVECFPDPSTADWLYLSPIAVVPGSALNPPRQMIHWELLLNTPHVIGPGLCYAGQLDPQDKSHFTIRFVRDDGEMILDGWLKNNDRVLLQKRFIPPPASSQAVR